MTLDTFFRELASQSVRIAENEEDFVLTKPTAPQVKAFFQRHEFIKENIEMLLVYFTYIDRSYNDALNTLLLGLGFSPHDSLYVFTDYSALCFELIQEYP